MRLKFLQCNYVEAIIRLHTTGRVPSVVRVPPNLNKGFLIVVYLNYLRSRAQYDFLWNL
jgi:hypothetical protein